MNKILVYPPLEHVVYLHEHCKALYFHESKFVRIPDFVDFPHLYWTDLCREEVPSCKPFKNFENRTNIKKVMAI